MISKRAFVGVLLLIALLGTLLAGCGGGGGNTTTGDDGGQENRPTPTTSPQDLFPAELPIHPEAYDFEANVPSNTYVYRVPGMVREVLEYLLPELEALGWEVIGAPTLMGHLANFNMKGETHNLSVSMQDNERSQTTRIQMILNRR